VRGKHYDEIAPLSVRSAVIRSAAMVCTVGRTILLPPPRTAAATNVYWVESVER
jgi:hypothetical protein